MAQRGLLWKEDEKDELAPTWTIEPDTSIIKSLADKHLPSSYTNINATFLAEGSFNKLYCISSPRLSQQYLMRVALPVVPFFKTESEIATLAYIRQYTTIPVPKVLAYCSSAENELGFEWVLMEKIEGVPLADVWDQMSIDSKASLTVEICEHPKVLQDLRFTQIGSLYFSSIRERVGTNASIDGTDFVIGRVVSPWFFRDKRMFLSGDRGLFPSSYEFIMAKTRMQIERTKHLSPFPTDDYYSETEEALAEEQGDVLDACYSLESLVPHISPPPNDEVELLCHDDQKDA